MKRITNILCYFGLLLILTVVACSDMDELTFPAQEDGEVELTLQTHVPGLDGVASRTAPTENITSITALAFDKQNKLIKVAKASLDREGGEESTSSVSGKFTVQVPMRTRHIHFIAKNNDDFKEITEANLGETDINLLVDRTSTDLHYWQMLDFEDANDLQDLSDELSSTNDTLQLVRNMAKLTLVTNSDSDYIAGFLNYNVKGTLVPYKETGEGESRVVKFGYSSEDTTNYDLPKTFLIHSDEQDRKLGKTHYIFEEFNDVGDLVYVICKVGGKFYKFAFKKDKTYYYIIRNCQYRIYIPDKLTESYGKDSYELAVSEGQVINDTEPQQVHIEIVPNPLYMFLTATGTATVTIPDGITTLSVAYFMEYFDQNGVTMSGYEGDKTQTSQDGLWIDTYTVTEGEKEFNITLKDSYKNGNNAIKGIEIGFQGTGDQNKYSNDELTVHALQQGTLTTITPTTYNLPNTAGSQFTVSVKIPTYNDEVGDFNLRVGDADGKYTVTPPDGLTLKDNGLYLVTEGETYTFTFTLNEEGVANEPHDIIFDVYTDFHDLEGKTTVTLIDNETPEPQSMYAIWVNGNVWEGTTGAVEFFGYETTAEGSFAAGDTPNGFRTEFYDDGANNHKQQAMVMGSDDSFTFTIPEGGMWLTMLVASNSGTPSIDLQKDDAAWKTSPDDNATTVKDTYNFGNGEINADGRLIRYQLPAGTYTLQGSAAEYLLYYMRVTKDKPIMTDIAQPLVADYELAWSGATYNNVNATGHLLPIDDDNYLHIVDENHLKHTVSLKDDNSLESKLNLTIADKSSFVLDLTINTTRVHFKEPGSNEYYKTPIEQEPEMDINGSCNLETYNAGVYSLKGTINTPSYKYSAFYDKLILDAVQYEVKSPIEPGLYNSMNGNVLTPVDKFRSDDVAWAIGFKMPKIVPDSVVKPENYTIDIDIPNWTISDDGDARGLGVEKIGTNNYRLQKQKQASDNDDNNNPEMYHPREGWTYKIKWASIYESKVIIPTLAGDELSDNMHYFIYDGTIAKEVSIPTPFETIENAEPDNTGGTTIWTGSQQWGDWSSNNPNYLNIYYFLPQGTEITLNVTSADGGAVEMHDCTLTSLRLESSNVTYPVQNDDYFSVGSGNTSPKFTVPSDGVNGLRINGSNVTITSVVVKYPNKTGQIFSKNFEDTNDMNDINGWGGNGYVAPSAPDGYLVLTNNGGFAQASVDMGYVPGSYTLTYRISGSASGSIKQNFQHYYTPKNTDGTNGNDVYDEDINNPKDQATQFTTEWDDVSISITINKGANRLLFDYSNFSGTIYIDNLTLVKND